VIGDLLHSTIGATAGRLVAGAAAGGPRPALRRTDDHLYGKGCAGVAAG
jgi:hypothetical protein